MNKFLNKKILLLGTNVGSIEIVKYAKAEGAYVIVADNLPDDKSPAKLIADESLLISTDEIEQLSKYVKENKINGVFCGVSEFNIRNVKRICDIADLPCYFSWEQWNTFMNKGNFRHLCEEYDVPTPKTFFSGTKDQYIANKEKITFTFPVIIKPTDCGANIGISICNNSKDLDNYLEIAFSSSDSNSAIVEQYIDGIEISSTYVVQNGICKMVCMGSKYAYKNTKGLRALSHAYIYPSPAITKYEKNIDEKIKNMILSQKLNNCTIFFQGSYDGNNFYIFESGLRMEGTASFRLTERTCGENFMHFMVDNAMGVNTEYNLDKENSHFNNRRCIIFSQISKEGVLSRIEGWDYVMNNPIIISSEQRHVIGTHIKDDGTLRQILFRYVLSDENEEKMIETIKTIESTIKAYDEYGNEMILNNDFDPSIILK